jgi:hypothetical protein
MTETFTFEKATKDQAKARIALAGPSGSGKTWTSLLIATAFGGTVAVIDTERGSASKYAGPFTFDRLNMQRYDPRDLPKALAAAAQAGYGTVIIDSLSKFWSGQGGMLEFVDNSTRRSGNNNAFTSGWKEARPVENDLIEAMLSYPGHVIVTMRTKTHYDVIDNGRGQKVPTKIGLQPVQRDGIEYEFDIVGDMDLENTLTISKSRCPAVAGGVFRQPGAEFAATVLEWLTDGRPVLSATDYREVALDKAATYQGLRDLYDRVKAAGLLGAAVAGEDGSAMNLQQLIISRGKEAEAAELFAAGAADEETAGEPAQGTLAAVPPAKGAKSGKDAA